MGGAEDTGFAAHPVSPAATVAARPAAAAPARMASVALRASIDPYLQLRARMNPTLEAPAIMRAQQPCCPGPLGPAGSGEVAQQRPCLCPAGAQPGRAVDDRPLLVVADAQAVVEDGDQPDGGEQPPQQRRVDVDGDGRPVAGRWRAPVPEVVGAA